MQWLNYHHLLYFWVVAREGSIVRASQVLHLAQPTISAQISRLEKALGAKLFERTGRNLRLTETGRTVSRYADEIFSLGQQLSDAVRGRPTGQPLRLAVGVPDVLPKLIVYRLLRPAFEMQQSLRLVCQEGKFEELVAALATHEIDLVLSDTMVGPTLRVKAFSHLLGQCGISFFATAPLAQRIRKGFPNSLAGAPLLMPGEGTTMRRLLDQWFDEQNFRPHVVAEFQDSALLKVFGKEGFGLFPAPSAIRDEIQRQYRVRHVGTLENLHERYYAISVERRIKHPAVLAISTAARRDLFS